MKLLLRTAWRNILGAGMRTWLNVSILSFVLVIMVAYNALLDGWFDKTRKESVEWEYASGQIWSEQYDPYDQLTLPDAHAKIPQTLNSLVDENEITPVLVVPASIFPQGRMINVQLKGIDPAQKIVRITALGAKTEGEIPVVIGKLMAKSAALEKGDVVMARWRDKNGTFDARSLLIADIFDSDNPNVDKGQIWMDINQLQDLTLLTGEASFFICDKTFQVEQALPAAWSYKDLDTLMKDFLLVEETNWVKSFITFMILLCLALLAVFDTQMLSIFKRKKEIGTYVALGMEPKRVVTMFTMEGVLYSLLAVLVGVIWGTPLMYWFNQVGYAVPPNSMREVIFTDAIYPTFYLSTILMTISVVVVMSGVISYFPARKIARMNMVLALKGKTE